MRTGAEIEALLPQPVASEAAATPAEGEAAPPPPSDWRNSEQMAADQRQRDRERSGREAAARRAIERATAAEAAMAEMAAKPGVFVDDPSLELPADPEGDDKFKKQHEVVEATWADEEAKDKAKSKWRPWRRHEGKIAREDRENRERAVAREASDARVAAERQRVEAIVNSPEWAEQQAAADQHQRDLEDQHHAAAVAREAKGPDSLREVPSSYNRIEDVEPDDLQHIELEEITTPGPAVEQPPEARAPLGTRIRERLRFRRDRGESPAAPTASAAPEAIAPPLVAGGDVVSGRGGRHSGRGGRHAGGGFFGGRPSQPAPAAPVVSEAPVAPFVPVESVRPEARPHGAEQQEAFDAQAFRAEVDALQEPTADATPQMRIRRLFELQEMVQLRTDLPNLRIMQEAGGRRVVRQESPRDYVRQALRRVMEEVGQSGAEG